MFLSRISTPRVFKESPDSRMHRAFISIEGLTVLYSEDKTDKWGWLKHASVAHPTRYPTWEEILEVKEQLFGNIDCMMVMPKKEDYVNVHNNCFHIWQTPQEWGIQ